MMTTLTVAAAPAAVVHQDGYVPVGAGTMDEIVAKPSHFANKKILIAGEIKGVESDGTYLATAIGGNHLVLTNVPHSTTLAQGDVYEAKVTVTGNVEGYQFPGDLKATMVPTVSVNSIGVYSD